ncbi:hypothetical protein V6917_11630 [Pectobacterium brasiliense]|uniref:hypothetical protein n=1 Tax=Pectobacterium brasiliense TaxID=180957 RepID=UPI0030CEAA9C
MRKGNKVDRWLVTGLVLFLFGLRLLIIFTGPGKTSDVSNWVSAFANIAMGAAAIMAWRTARKFLSEFFTQEGYRLAIALINENVIHLGDANRFALEAEEACKVCSELHGEEHSLAGTNRLERDVGELNKVLNANRVWLNNIQQLMFKIETYGIWPAEDKAQALEQYPRG